MKFIVLYVLLVLLIAVAASSRIVHGQVSSNATADPQHKLVDRFDAGQNVAKISTSQPTDSPAVWLGIQMLNTDDVRKLNIKNTDGTILSLPDGKGVFIVRVFEKGNASKAGLLTGDIITEVDGVAIPDAKTLSSWVAKAVVGNRYTLGIFRNKSGKWEPTEIRLTAIRADESARQAAAAFMETQKQLGDRDRAALATKPIGLILTGKELCRATVGGAPAADTIALSYSCRNNAEKPVRAFMGTLVFSDLFDREVKRYDLTLTATASTKTLDVGKEEVSSQIAIPLDHSNAEQWLLNTDIDDMKVRFEPRELLFSDGTKLMVPLPDQTKQTDGAEEVTTRKLRTLAESYEKKKVSLTGLTFEEADNIWVDQLPGIMINGDGALSYIDTKRPERWVGFSACDPDNDNPFQYFFASKKDFGDLVVGFKRGQKFNVTGTVVRLDRPGWFGLVCTKVEAVPEAAPACRNTP